MSERFEDLPIEIQQRVLSFIGDREDGRLDDDAMKGLIAFIVENADAYPALLNLVKVNEERVIEHAKETGEVPPESSSSRPLRPTASRIVGEQDHQQRHNSSTMAGHNGHLWDSWRRLRWPRSLQFLSSSYEPVHVRLHGARRPRGPPSGVAAGAQQAGQSTSST